MENAVFIGQIVGPVYFVLGLSILFYMKPWTKLMDEYQKNHFAFMPMAMMGMVIGLLIINSYNEWTWNIYLVVTVTGWVALVKGIFYLMAPGSWTKAVIDTFKKNTAWAAVWGAISVLLGAALSYYSYMA